jgi:hypothetical protein
MKDVNIRFTVPEDVHAKVLKVQGLFSFKEGKKTSVQQTYIRLVERGVAEIMKQNRSRF